MLMSMNQTLFTRKLLGPLSQRLFTLYIESLKVWLCCFQRPGTLVANWKGSMSQSQKGAVNGRVLRRLWGAVQMWDVIISESDWQLTGIVREKINHCKQSTGISRSSLGWGCLVYWQVGWNSSVIPEILTEL